MWPTIDLLDPPDLPRHVCNSDRGPGASGGLTVLANDRNGRRLRLNASHHDDDDDDESNEVYASNQSCIDLIRVNFINRYFYKTLSLVCNIAFRCYNRHNEEFLSCTSVQIH